MHGMRNIVSQLVHDGTNCVKMDPLTLAIPIVEGEGGGTNFRH